MRTWANIFWLGTKELRSVLGDALMVGLIIWAVRSWKAEQVEKPEFRINEVHRTEVL